MTVRQVITRSTAAAGSPQSKPTLSHGSASRDGAKSSSHRTISATVLTSSRPPDSSQGRMSSQSRRVTGPGAGNRASPHCPTGMIPRTELLRKTSSGRSSRSKQAQGASRTSRPSLAPRSRIKPRMIPGKTLPAQGGVRI